MVYKPIAVRVALVAGFQRALSVFFRYVIVVAEAVGMWEGWKAGFMAFHPFHTRHYYGLFWFVAIWKSRIGTSKLLVVRVLLGHLV